MLNNLLTKRARLFFEFIKYKITKKRKPIVAYLLLTDRCNRRCRYCFVDCSKTKKELNLHQWKKIIDTLVKQGTKMICLMGGEPLISPYIEPIVDYIKKRGLICDMTSNGILVKPKIEIIKKLDSLMISLDGNKEANDVNRGPGAYDKALEAIRVARENGVTVRINCVLTKQNKNCLKYLVDLADQYNLFVTYSILAEFPEKEKMLAEKIKLSDEEIRKIYKKLKRWKQEGKKILFSLPTLDYIINYPASYKKIIFSDDKETSYYRGECFFGRVMFYIDCDGSFYPCATLWNSNYYKPKTIIKDGFKKSWENMNNLKCKTCSCPGIPEWEYLTSISGLKDGLKLTFSQIFSKKFK